MLMTPTLSIEFKCKNCVQTGANERSRRPGGRTLGKGAAATAAQSLSNGLLATSTPITIITSVREPRVFQPWGNNASNRAHLRVAEVSADAGLSA